MMIQMMNGIDKKQLAVAMMIMMPTVVPSSARPMPSSSGDIKADRRIPIHVLAMATKYMEM